ncbi:odorant receptor 49b-like [Harpegnathos saltator]|uniref:odorant receptor 49b-like n=1 Tax=Harpegnathos saltator TaxID=610380 RepID=UPI000DBEEADD|nr:odorant receptor 49b-like [Harpegnathos saltator]
MLPLATPVLDIVSPLNETRPRKLPHKAEYFMSQEKHYYVLWLSQHVSYIICCIVLTAIDTTFFLLMEHVCGMHTILCYRLKNLTVYDTLSQMDNICVNKNYEINERARRCIQLDRRIRVFVQIMESTFMTCFLFDIGLGFILHTCVCIIIVVRTGQLAETVRFLAILIPQLFRIFFSNWIGQEVIDHSSEIPQAAYSAMWYDMPVKVQKMIMLLIARSQKPSKLTVAKFYIINLESFNMVMKTSMSYCTVMISLSETSDSS